MHCKSTLLYLQYEAFMRRSKWATLYARFDSLKRLYKEVNGKYTDSIGGFVHFDKMDEIAKEIGVKKDTLRKQLKKMLKLGWVKLLRSGYKLVAWKKVALSYGHTLNKRLVAGKDKTERAINSAELFYKAELSRRGFAKADKEQNIKRLKPKLKKIKKHESVLSHDIGVSTREVAKAVGFASSRSVCKVNQKLERNGKIIVVKNESKFSDKKFDKFRNSDDFIRNRVYTNASGTEMVRERLTIFFKREAA